MKRYVEKLPTRMCQPLNNRQLSVRVGKRLYRVHRAESI
jgi:hypothetical protein